MMTLTVGGRSFEVDTVDSPSTDAILAMLPLEVRMVELNDNEKYCDLGGSVPSSPVRVGSIEAGDVMLYGDDCLVFFYRSFRTPYSYTRIGRVRDVSGLESADGPGVLADGGRSSGRTRRRGPRGPRTRDSTGGRHPLRPSVHPYPIRRGRAARGRTGRAP